MPVWFDALHVADVEVASDGALSLRYADRWRQTTGAFPLSVTMPLRAAPYTSEITSPWLANLLPEEEQLRSLTRSLGLDQADALAMLERIGGDTAGALSFGLASDRSRWAHRPLTDLYGIDTPAAALDRHFEDLGSRPFLVGEEGVRQSLAGGQKKSALAVARSRCAGRCVRLPEPGDVLGPSPCTARPLDPDREAGQPPTCPGITENMRSGAFRMAAALGLEAAQADHSCKPRRRSAIAVLRYDRRLGRQGQLVRLHQEDFAQANGLPPGRKYERGTLPGLDLKSLLEDRAACQRARCAVLCLDQVNLQHPRREHRRACKEPTL